MEKYNAIKEATFKTVCLLHAFLFVYAAVNKLMDFKNFSVQLGQSPLLGALGPGLVWGVPLAELLIAVALCIPILQRAGLYAGFSMMVMFSTYIVMILNFSTYIPCSCGGILESLGWAEHLLFNLAFVTMAFVALFIRSKGVAQRKKPRVITLLVIIMLSAGSIVLLHGLSDNALHRQNTFIRFFPPHGAREFRRVDLKYNSYYFAGAAQGKIYLGNYTAPFTVVVYDTLLKSSSQHRIAFRRKGYAFRSLHLNVSPPYFYMSDGTVPVILKGNTDSWQVSDVVNMRDRFTQAIPVDTSLVALRGSDRITNENILGTVNVRTGQTHFSPGILKKQIDGIFDTDGTLLYDTKLQRLLYIYLYRNQFILSDSSFRKISYGHTIDTIQKAQLKIAYLPGTGQKTLAGKPLIVNNLAWVSEGRLYVNSFLPGRGEPLDMWEGHSIIDVYDVASNDYISSFYVEAVNGLKMRDFIVYGHCVYALCEHQLLGYSFNGTLLPPQLDK
jgi:hypothetical protein